MVAHRFKPSMQVGSSQFYVSSSRSARYTVRPCLKEKETRCLSLIRNYLFPEDLVLPILSERPLSLLFFFFFKLGSIFQGLGGSRLEWISKKILLW